MADTNRRYVIAPEEGYVDKIDWRATKQEVIKIAFNLLRKKALRLGASEEDLKMELLEDQEFRMVQGFYPVGRSIRVRAQVKPGLIRSYSEATA